MSIVSQDVDMFPARPSRWVPESLRPAEAWMPPGSAKANFWNAWDIGFGTLRNHGRLRTIIIIIIIITIISFFILFLSLSLSLCTALAGLCPPFGLAGADTAVLNGCNRSLLFLWSFFLFFFFVIFLSFPFTFFIIFLISIFTNQERHMRQC